MISGKYFHQMDEKGRIRIPPECKDELGDKLFIMAGANKCLYAYPYEKGVAELKSLLAKANTYDPDDEMSLALTYLASLGYEVKPDKSGRILLNKELLKHAGITKNVVTVGFVDRLQIWSEEHWKEHCELTAAQYDNLLRRKKKRGEDTESDGNKE